MKYSSSDVWLEKFHLRRFSKLCQDSSSPHNTNLLWVGHWAPLLACGSQRGRVSSPSLLAEAPRKAKEYPPSQSQAAQMLTADLRQPMDSTQQAPWNPLLSICALQKLRPVDTHSRQKSPPTHTHGNSRWFSKNMFYSCLEMFNANASHKEDAVGFTVKHNLSTGK